jgi:hypothetical protein
MPQENVEVVERVIAAFNERDIDQYLACCTEDIELQTPAALIEGAYEGPDGIRRYFADVRDIFSDMRIITERLESIGADRVLAFLRLSATGRVSGLTEAVTPTATAAGIPTGNVYDLAEGKIRRIRIFFYRQAALEAAGLRE